MFQLHFM